MEGANLWQVNLSKANLSTTRLKGAKIINPVYCDTEMPWGLERNARARYGSGLMESGLRSTGTCMSTVEVKKWKAANKKSEPETKSYGGYYAKNPELLK